jgi:hypothetical protein
MTACLMPWMLVERYNWKQRQCYLRDHVLQWLTEHEIKYVVLSGSAPIIRFERLEDHVLFKLTWL